MDSTSTAHPEPATPRSEEAGDPRAVMDAALREHPVSVLLVDDQPIIGEAVRRMLEGQTDIQFRFIDDPTQAIEVAAEVRPTVILSDLVMPQLDGLELVRRFRANEGTKDIPLIVLSSKEEATTKAEAFGLGANDYLVKLPDKLELIARIRYHSTGYINLLQRNEAYEALIESQRVLADDLEQAANYVRSLLPEPLEERVLTEWRFIPCDSLGGDTFGYHWLDDDHFVVYLMDVSGHGVGAALLSVSVLNLLSSGSLPNTDFCNPGQVITRLNEAFRMDRQSGKYFTIWYGVYKASTRTLRYSGGGHPAALLLPPAGQAATPEILESSGPMPGFLNNFHWGSMDTQVTPGARLLLYSDGVFELPRQDGSMAGFDEFVRFVGSAEDGDSPVVTRVIGRAERMRKGEGFDDDVSVVAVRFP